MDMGTKKQLRDLALKIRNGDAKAKEDMMLIAPSSMQYKADGTLKTPEVLASEVLGPK